MKSYKISFYNDMGHLMTEPKIWNMPDHIYKFAYEKIKNKLVYATDNDRLGCRFYILKPGLSNQWTYNFNGVHITMDYSQLDRFNPNTMRYF